MNKFLILYLLITSTCLSYGQNTFIQIGDATGLKFSSADSTKLDSIATAFKNILPSGSQSTFKVFTAGIYWHAPNYSGFNEWLEGVLNSAISTYSGQYYLAFFIVKGSGNSTDWRVVTRMNLPSEVYECTEAYYNVLLKSLLQMDFSVDPKDGAVPFNALADQIATVIPNIGEVVNHMLNCCNGLRSECPISLDPNELLYLMTSNGYVGVFLDSIAHTINDTIIHSFLKGDNFTVFFKNNSINILSDLGPFFNELNGVLSSFGGSSLYFNGLNLDELMIQVTGSSGPPPSLQINPNQRSITSTYSTNGMINIDVVGMEIMEMKMLFARIRERETYPNLNIPGKIYLVKAGSPSGVNFNLIKQYVDSYMSCTEINVPSIVREAGIHENELNIRDAVALVGGHEPLIVRIAEMNYCSISEGYISELQGWSHCNNPKLNKISGAKEPEWDKVGCDVVLDKGYSDDPSSQYPGLPKKVGHGKGGRLIVVAGNKIDQNALNLFRVDTKNELIGFLIVHASGHTAGLRHLKLDDPGWIMYDGKWFRDVIFGLDPNVDLIKLSTETSDYHKQFKEQAHFDEIKFIRKCIKTRFLKY